MLFESETAGPPKEEVGQEPPRKKRKNDGHTKRDVPNISTESPRNLQRHGENYKRTSQSSENRRQRRIRERLTDTTCFACRQQGHTAQNCPSNDHQETKGTRLTGICYRCGSTRHSLSRCPKPADEANPTPFASCFICHEKGHLSSSCGKNVKGVYPNGGSCKLCGQTSHLAKNCPLRSTAPSAESLLFNAASGMDAPGADEDDFIVFKRKSNQVNKEEESQKSKKGTGKPPAAGRLKIVSF